MADVITQLQQIFVKKETTEGTEALGAATDAILVDVGSISRPTAREFNERSQMGAMGTRNGKIGGITGAGVGFTTEIKGNGTTTLPEVHELLESVFGTFTTDTLASTATGGTSTVITTASTAGLTAGNAILVETGSGTNLYEMTFVTSLVANTSITVSPALTFSPVNTAKLKGTTTYKLADSGHSSLSIQDFLNSTDYIGYTGCRGNLKFSSPKAGDIPKLAFDFKAWAWALSTAGTRPTSTTYDTALPASALSTKFKIAGTATDILMSEWDLGNVVTSKLSQNASTGVYGTPVTDRKVRGSFRIHAVGGSVAPFTGWTANTQITLSQQFGNTQFGTIGWYCPQAERSDVQYGDDGGVTTVDVKFNANVSNTATDAIYLAVG